MMVIHFAFFVKPFCRQTSLFCFLFQLFKKTPKAAIFRNFCAFLINFCTIFEYFCCFYIKAGVCIALNKILFLTAK